jgi:glycosyltransferase involved in cell wall biosynthesis
MYHIFISCMAYDSGQSGISDYMRNVVQQLSQEHQLDVVLLAQDAETFPIRNENIRLIPVSMKLARPIVNMLWHLYILPRYLRKKPYDFAFLPAGNRRLFCRYPLFTVVTFHDLSQYHIPQKYDRMRMFYIRRVIPHYVKKAPAVVAVSAVTREDMITHYGMDGGSISVAWNGYDRQRFCLRDASHTIAQLTGDTKPYLLYVARVEHPGKNHLNLIKAFEQLPPELRQNMNLVFAGGLKERSDEVTAYAEQSVAAENIRFLGFVDDDALPDLYRQATIFVMPSLYEGFGIPLIEAMACGTPVVCSDRGPMPEVVGDAALLFNPDKPAEMAATLQQVLEDVTLQDELKKKGLRRCQQFSWEAHATHILARYQERNDG